jgi:hypothetical protein
MCQFTGSLCYVMCQFTGSLCYVMCQFTGSLCYVMCQFWRLRWSSGLRADLWFPSSRVRTRPKPLNFFRVKNPRHALNTLSHVPTLRHVKEPLSRSVLRAESEITSTVSSFANRGLSRRLVRWRLWRWMRELFTFKGLQWACYQGLGASGFVPYPSFNHHQLLAF